MEKTTLQGTKPPIWHVGHYWLTNEVAFSIHLPVLHIAEVSVTVAQGTGVGDFNDKELL